MISNPVLRTFSPPSITANVRRNSRSISSASFVGRGNLRLGLPLCPFFQRNAFGGRPPISYSPSGPLRSPLPILASSQLLRKPAHGRLADQRRLTQQIWTKACPAEWT